MPMRKKTNPKGLVSCWIWIIWLGFSPDPGWLLWQLSENISSDLCCGKWAIRMLHYTGRVTVMMSGWSYIAHPGPVPVPVVKWDCFCGVRVSVLSVMGYITPGEHRDQHTGKGRTVAVASLQLGGKWEHTPIAADHTFLQCQHCVNSAWHWVEERNV